MKKLTLCCTLFIIYGCNQPVLNSSSSVASSGDCPDKPEATLREQDVTEITLNQETLTQSGRATTTQSVGYKFDAESGQRLSYFTDADICIWVYTPDNQIINTKELPTDGKYIIQVSAPQGLRNFDLQMALNSLEPSPSSTPVTVAPTNVSNNITQPEPNNQNQARNSTNQSSNQLSRTEALEIVKKWYAAKPRIFGPPYDISLVRQLATGRLYTSTTKPDGSVAWLKNNNAYYTYKSSEITNILEFSNSGRQPYIKVSVAEELYLYGRNGISRTNSGFYRGNFIYTFQKENGVWKIYDSKKVN
jgi:hypothetical protein